MEIKIRSLVLRNFKGIKNLTISDLGNEVIVKGMNETGKTTIMDAVLWLLFSKDSTGRKDFSIKTLDPKTGESLHRLEHEVIAELSVDGELITLKKIYKEKWTKPRGKAEAEFSGHESLYFYNDIPLAEKDYNAKIQGICPEQLFKLLTNPLVFPSLPWQDQRKILFDIAGNIKDEDIISDKPEWQEFLEVINKHKTLDEYKKEIAAKKRKIKEEIDTIPGRIDEVQRSIPTEKEDWKAIEKAIIDKSEEIKTIDRDIADISASMEKVFAVYRTKQTEINNKKIHLTNIENDEAKKVRENHYEANIKFAELNSRIKNVNRDIEQLNKLIKGTEEERNGYVKDRDELRKEWGNIVADKIIFNDENFCCPTCKRYFDEGYIVELREKMTQSFNEDKQTRLAKNVEAGKKKASLINFCNETIEINEEELHKFTQAAWNLKKEIDSFDVPSVEAHCAALDMNLVLKDNAEYHKLSADVKKLQESITEPKKLDISAQTSAKEIIQKELKDLIQRLNQREFTNKAIARVEELIAEQKKLAQELANLERIEFNIQSFTRAKIDAIEGKVNGMFSIVKWKMFDKLINGELQETCEATVSGVPYPDVNNGAKIQGGLDIINTLSSHYNIYAPIFVDNRESVTELPAVKSQLISLIVDPKYKELNIISK